MERRIVKVCVSVDMLIAMMTNGHIIEPAKCVKGIPADAEFIGMTIESTMLVSLIFHHASFKPIPLNSDIPVTEVWYEAIFKGGPNR